MKKVVCLSCFFWLLPCTVFAAGPVLLGRVTDPRGKPVGDAEVRVQTEDGRATELRTDSRGGFRIEVSRRFQIEIRHDGYRTIQASSPVLSGESDDVFQADIPMRIGAPEDVETVVLQIEGVPNPDSREEPTVREGLPKSDRLFGLRGGV